ncbi:hypothetical protein V5P93_000959 [Actinokineospora auranticolor]|uniref:Tetratricopeptide repeat protein n=1 Tax=Actinokineospora auranticolor TaxID=155976 RepID=A0A2S6GY62_9PSEU|nr:hypothetical protein [Actinokineospora auranticolor]PPK70163.1 hypothetical protein CLV40_10273 [Actinokineospora auranticolor]
MEALPRFGDVSARALALRVNPAVPLPLDASTELDPDLPLFVPRGVWPDLGRWVRRAAETGGFLLLTGDSSVGKSRLLYELGRAELADFDVLVPDLGDGDRVNNTTPSAKLVVWLDELQRFLDGPYLTPGSTPITPAAIRRLLDAPTPVVILAAAWPNYLDELRAKENGLARHPAAYDVLDDRRLHEVPLHTFTTAERAEAVRLAPRDPRLVDAVADKDFNVTELLAGARDLMTRYGRANDEQRAIIHAAADARRLGIQSPLTKELLVAAARGYLSTVHPDDSWFDPALAELTTSNRGASPLLPIPDLERRDIVGYTVADYLLSRLLDHRRSETVPAPTWRAFTDLADDESDVRRLADGAQVRAQYRCAEALFRRLADHWDIDWARYGIATLLLREGRTKELASWAAAGDPEAADVWVAHLLAEGREPEAESVLRQAMRFNADRFWRSLVDLLDEGGRPAEVIDVMRIAAATSDGFHLHGVERRLADQLAAGGDVDGALELLRPHVDDSTSRERLVDILETNLRWDELAALADSGDVIAQHALARSLKERGDEKTLRSRAGSGDTVAAEELARLLLARGAIDEAISALPDSDAYAADRFAHVLIELGHADVAVALLRPYAAEVGIAARTLAGVLREKGEHAQAAAVIRPHVGTTALAELCLDDALAELGDLGELQERSAAGDESAQRKLVSLLVDRELIPQLRELAEENTYAVVALAWDLVRADEVDEALAVLRPYFETSRRCRRTLIELLRTNRRIDELADYAEDSASAAFAVAWLDPERAVRVLTPHARRGDSEASRRLVQVLADRADIAALWAELHAGNTYALQHLVDLIPEGDRLRKFGLNPDGTLAG